MEINNSLSSIASLFTPIEDFFIGDDSNLLGNHIDKHLDDFPNLNNCQIALIGLLKFRGLNDNVEKTKKLTQSNLQIRKSLYALNISNLVVHCHISDLGNLQLGDTYESTLEKIKIIGSLLIMQNIFPFFFGGTKDLNFGQFKIYQDLDKLISIVNIDKKFNMLNNSFEQNDGDSQNTVNNDNVKNNYRIITHNPNYLFNYSHIGYQNYFVSNKELKLMDLLNFDYIRVGEVHTDIEPLELLIRDADMLCSSVDVLNGFSASGQEKAAPFGLSPEQFCQLFWYAGLNEKMSSAAIFDYIEEKDDANYSTSQVIAVSIWYFLEGFMQRKDNLEFYANDYIVYYCPIEGSKEDLVFYKSLVSDKWWLKIPSLNQNLPYSCSYLVSCSEKDFSNATKGNIPDIYIKTIERLG